MKKEKPQESPKRLMYIEVALIPLSAVKKRGRTEVGNAPLSTACVTSELIADHIADPSMLLV